MDERDRNRVLWRSRRGMLELDLLLVDFARQRYPHLSPTEQSAYQALLDLDDALIWDWLQGRATPPPTVVSVVRRIVAFNEEQAP